MGLTENCQVRLRDGRALGYAEFGAAAGKPVLYFHGFPGSRLEARMAADAAARLQIRLIAIDRPGVGLSDFQPGRSLADWPHDVLDLADTLTLRRFAVLGVSGGGPYAAVCAARIPFRLTRVGIVAGLAPMTDPERERRNDPFARFPFSLARVAPWLGRPLYYAGAGRVLRRNPEKFLKYLRERSPVADRMVLARPEVHEALLDSVLAATAGGSRGGGRELTIHGRPWGFHLQEIPIEVLLWHGELDAVVPVSMGRYLARTIPKCRACFLPGEGHYSLPVNHMEEILAALAP
jgi:pimeloyl-ACP methyl ester carboxylesterase